MPRWVPHEYQKKAIRFLLERDYGGLFQEPGLGKTAETLAVLKRLKLRGKNKSALIIAPLRPCYLVWPKEIKKWGNFNSLSYCILHGKDKELKPGYDIYIINPDGLDWLFNTALYRSRNWPFDILVVDESTKFKHTDTQRFKVLKPRLKKFSKRYILTGSPASNGLKDLFGQMWVMDLGQTFGTEKGKFEKRYFYKGGFKGKVLKPYPASADRIHRAIAPSVLQMSALDYLKMPEIIINDVFVELPPAARKAYNEMEEVLRVNFEAGRVTAANLAVSMGKCRQIASGGIYLDAGGSHHVHQAKTEAVEELMEELSGNSALVAYEFHHDLDRLLKLFGKNTPHISGGVSMRRTVQIEKEWNEGEHTVLLVQPQSASLGLNLQGNCSCVIWHTLTYRYDDYDQLIRRVWRQGQKSKRVMVHRIIAKDTIDEVVSKTLESKGKGQQALFDSIQEYWREA